MKSDLGEFFGYMTAVINFFLFLPQVVHVYKVKDTRSISTNFILLQVLSCISTLTYAVIINEYPLMVSSISILISSSTIGYAKWILYPSVININQYESIV
tara:strand:- start:446 stop:745 length:300 start_codon:yes stop_codon:yes gene_type:complete